MANRPADAVSRRASGDRRSRTRQVLAGAFAVSGGVTPLDFRQSLGEPVARRARPQNKFTALRARLRRRPHSSITRDVGPGAARPAGRGQRYALPTAVEVLKRSTATDHEQQTRCSTRQIACSGGSEYANSRLTAIPRIGRSGFGPLTLPTYDRRSPRSGFQEPQTAEVRTGAHTVRRALS